MSPQLTLIIRTADGVSRQRAVGTGTFTLGREPGCDIVVESSDVSRHHARLILSGKDFQVVDLGSTLGSKLNGRPVTAPNRSGTVAYVLPGLYGTSRPGCDRCLRLQRRRHRQHR